MGNTWENIKKEVMDKFKTDLSKHEENFTTAKQHYFMKGQCLDGDYESVGLYYMEYDLLWDKLVPASGDSETIIGEMIRILGRLNHEYYNNGNCNLQEAITEECSVCDGTGYEECPHCDEGYVYHYEEGKEIKEVCPDCDGRYEYYEDCWSCHGEIYVDTGEYEITNYYATMLEFIKDKISYITKDYHKVLVSCEQLEDMLKNHYCYSNEKNQTYRNRPIEQYYNTFTDELMYVILQSETNPVNPLYEVAEV